MKLYTVTVESEFVWASECEDEGDVAAEFQRAIRGGDSHLCNELSEGAVYAHQLSALPSNYELDALPYGTDLDEDERTIGEMIEEGCAPKYTEMLAKLLTAKASLKVTP